MYQPILSKHQSFTIFLEIITKKPERLRIYTHDMHKSYTKFTDRFKIVNGRFVEQIRLPITPDELGLGVYNANTTNDPRVNDRSFQANVLSYSPLQTCDVWMDADTKSFTDFAKDFAVKAGVTPVGNAWSNDGKFHIVYSDVIKDKTTGRILYTPSNIGHETGIIKVAREQFLKFTVPMRYMILLHEFAHKWMNPKRGKKITDESAADLNALYIYLGEGFPRVDARTVFLKVIYNVTTDENIKRYEAIDNFIKQYDAGLISKCSKK